MMTLNGPELAMGLIADLDRRSDKLEIQFEQCTLRWRRIGEGPPLVLLHGGNGSWLHWVRNIDALAHHHTLWLPDLPGCGESQELAAPASLERLVCALSYSLDSLLSPGQEVGLVAFSFGSVLAANLAIARNTVNRLALMGPTGHGLPRSLIPLLNWRLLSPGDAQDNAHRHNLKHLMLHSEGSVDDLAMIVHREASERARLRSKKISHTDSMRRALDQLNIPVLMVWGEHDPTAEAASAAHILTEEHANRRSVLMPGAGHWVQYERPDEINALLVDWF